MASGAGSEVSANTGEQLGSSHNRRLRWLVKYVGEGDTDRRKTKQIKGCREFSVQGKETTKKETHSSTLVNTVGNILR